MFERTLQDLIRGLRAHKASSKAQEDAFLAEAMNEIRDELKGKDMALKAEGVLKVCYVSCLPHCMRYLADFKQLMMLYPIPPPPGFAFHVVEVMSSPRYHLKRELGLGILVGARTLTWPRTWIPCCSDGIHWRHRGSRPHRQWNQEGACLRGLR